VAADRSWTPAIHDQITHLSELMQSLPLPSMFQLIQPENSLSLQTTNYCMTRDFQD